MEYLQRPYTSFIGDLTPEELKVKQIFSDPQNYTILKPLGKGSFATTYLIKTRDNHYYAGKATPEIKINTKNYKMILKESVIQRGLDLKGTVKTYGMFRMNIKNTNYVVIIMDFYPGLPIADYLQREAISKELYLGKPREFMHLIYILAKDIQELHQNNIVHMDLNEGNILVYQHKPKLIDLGLSCRLDEPIFREMDSCNTPRGTPQFMAPEIFAKKFDFIFKADVWSFGAIVYFLVYQKYPFDPYNDDLSDLIENLKNPPKYDDTSYSQAVETIKYCLVNDPSLRPGIDQVCQFILQYL